MNDAWDKPCPHCGELGHIMIASNAVDPVELFCPALPVGSRLIWTGITFIRDNRGQFAEKTTQKEDDEWPEFTDAADFFDAHQILDVPR